MQNSTITLVGIEPNFALYELQHALTNGIFEPIRKMQDAHLHLREVIREIKLTGTNSETGKKIEEQVTLTFIAPCSLNSQAESILLAIIKLAGTDGLRIEPDQPQLPLFNVTEDNARQKATVKTTCTKYKVLRVAGIGDDNKNYKLLDFYLDQMATVTVKWQNHTTGWKGRSHLMDYAIHENGSLIVQLNWRLASVILGIPGYEYAVIDLNERHALTKDASKTLHRWLSAHLWTGRTEYITYEKL